MLSDEDQVESYASKASPLDQSELQQLADLLSTTTPVDNVGHFRVEVEALQDHAILGVKKITLRDGENRICLIAKPQSKQEYIFHARFQEAFRLFPSVRVPDLFGYTAGIGFMEYVSGLTLLEWLRHWRYGKHDDTMLSNYLSAVADLQIHLMEPALHEGTTTIRAFLEEQASRLRFDQYFSKEVLARSEKMIHSFEPTGILDYRFPRSLVHGDLAPANLIVTHEGLVLIDFMFSNIDLAIWDPVYFYQALSYPDYFYSMPEVGARFRTLYQKATPVPLDDDVWQLLSLAYRMSTLRHGLNIALWRSENEMKSHLDVG